MKGEKWGGLSVSLNIHIQIHTHTHTHRWMCYNIMPERNLENDPLGAGGRSRGNSCDEVWHESEWGFMVGTARDRDIHQPSLQCAGKHRSGRLYPVAQPKGLTTPCRYKYSPVSHFLLLITAYLLVVLCELDQGIFPQCLYCSRTGRSLIEAN